MNHTSMIVRLTKDPEIRYTSGEKSTAVAKFSVACDKDFKKDGEVTANFYNCIAFGKTAQVIEKYIFKGSQVGLEGVFENNNWTDKDGNKHYDFQFNVSKLTFIGSKNQNNGNSSSSNSDSFMVIPDNVEDESLPFN